MNQGLNIHDVTVGSIIAHMGRNLIAAAERHEDSSAQPQDLERATYDALVLLLSGKATAAQVLAQWPILREIETDLLEFVQRLQIFINQVPNNIAQADGISVMV